MGVTWRWRIIIVGPGLFVRVVRRRHDGDVSLLGHFTIKAASQIVAYSAKLELKSESPY